MSLLKTNLDQIPKANQNHNQLINLKQITTMNSINSTLYKHKSVKNNQPNTQKSINYIKIKKNTSKDTLLDSNLYGNSIKGINSYLYSNHLGSTVKPKGKPTNFGRSFLKTSSPVYKTKSSNQNQIMEGENIKAGKNLNSNNTIKMNSSFHASHGAHGISNINKSNSKKINQNPRQTQTNQIDTGKGVYKLFKEIDVSIEKRLITDISIYKEETETLTENKNEIPMVRLSKKRIIGKDQASILLRIRNNNNKITNFIVTSQYDKALLILQANLELIEDYTISFPFGGINKRLIIFNLYNIAYCYSISNNGYSQKEDKEKNINIIKYIEAGLFHYDCLIENKYLFACRTNRSLDWNSLSNLLFIYNLSNEIKSYKPISSNSLLSINNIISYISELGLYSKMHLQLSFHIKSTENINKEMSIETLSHSLLSLVSCIYMFIYLERLFFILKNNFNLISSESKEKEEEMNTNSVFISGNVSENTKNKAFSLKANSKMMKCIDSNTENEGNGNDNEEENFNEEYSLCCDKINEFYNTIKQVYDKIISFLDGLSSCETRFKSRVLTYFDIEKMYNININTKKSLERSMLGIRSDLNNTNIHTHEKYKDCCDSNKSNQILPIHKIDIVSFLKLPFLSENELLLNNSHNLYSFKDQLNTNSLFEKIILLSLSSYYSSKSFLLIKETHISNDEKHILHQLSHSFIYFSIEILCGFIPKGYKIPKEIINDYLLLFRSRFETIENDDFFISFKQTKNQDGEGKERRRNEDQVKSQNQKIEEVIEDSRSEVYKKKSINTYNTIGTYGTYDNEDVRTFIINDNMTTLNSPPNLIYEINQIDEEEDNQSKKMMKRKGEAEQSKGNNMNKISKEKDKDKKKTSSTMTVMKNSISSNANAKPKDIKVKERQVAYFTNKTTTTKSHNTIDCIVNNKMKLEIQNTKPINLNSINLVTINSDGFAPVQKQKPSQFLKGRSRTNEKKETNNLKKIIYYSKAKGNNENKGKNIVKDNVKVNLKNHSLLHSIFFDSQSIVKNKYKTITYNESSSSYSKLNSKGTTSNLSVKIRKS